MQPCGHCGREFPAADLIPVAMRGAASMNGHLVSISPGSTFYMDVDPECFVLLDVAPIGEIVDLREPPPIQKSISL